MTPAARSTSVMAPSSMASAKPRTDVRGVRSSWDTERRKSRSAPRARARLSAMALIDRANDASSGSAAGGSGTRAARSPAAMRPVTSWAASRGRTKRCPRRLATTIDARMMMMAAATYHGPPAASPVGGLRVRTTTRVTALLWPPSWIEAA